MTWFAGERVIHPVFGLGTVRVGGDGGGPVVVDFDRGGPGAVGERVAWLQRAEPHDLLPPPAPVFVLEPEDESHSTADRLVAIGAGPAWLARQMGEAFSAGHPRVPPEDANAGAAGDVFGSLPQGYSVSFPRADRGIVGTIRRGDAAQLVGIAPFYDGGIRIPVTLSRVLIDRHRVNARLCVAFGPAALGLYDTRFCVRRHTYVERALHEVVLAGFAYECGPPVSDILEIPAAERDPGAPERIDLRGFAGLLPAHGGDVDEYEFRGPVRDVSEVEFATGPMMRLVVTVIRELDGWGDLDLPILVAPHAWTGAEPPRPGQDVEGLLWLQGFIPDPAEDA